MTPYLALGTLVITMSVMAWFALRWDRQVQEKRKIKT